jgi:hypothetical protein
MGCVLSFVKQPILRYNILGYGGWHIQPNMLYWKSGRITFSRELHNHFSLLFYGCVANRVISPFTYNNMRGWHMRKLIEWIKRNRMATMFIWWLLIISITIMVTLSIVFLCRLDWGMYMKPLWVISPTEFIDPNWHRRMLIKVSVYHWQRRMLIKVNRFQYNHSEIRMDNLSESNKTII